MENDKKIIVTSALPYVNNVPHLGNIVCILSADTYSRYLRSQGRNVIFVCGTDEHGTTAEVKALEMKMTPRQLVDHFFEIHKKAYEWFECKFDCFGRTSSAQNHEITQHIFKKAYENEYFISEETEQLYCEKCNKFLSDRFVNGECPKCNYSDARGDQCDKCSSLLNPSELVNPKCSVCLGTPIARRTKHLFIDLPKLAPLLEKFISEREIFWSQNAKQQTHAWLKTGLRPRSMTRDLKWGIPVPVKEFEGKVIYSWFDAPIGYISITAENKKDWKEWWQNPEMLGRTNNKIDNKSDNKTETELVQFMGKDNIPFHTILFPSFLLATHEPWVLVKKLSVNEYLNYENTKFSKSRGTGVFLDDAMKTGIEPDVWRYYIMKNRPEQADTTFYWNDFQEKNNKELLANLGNFVNRTLTFLKREFEGKIPAISDAELSDADRKFFGEINAKIQKVTELLDDIQLKEGLQEIMLLSKQCNQYFQEQAPWVLAKTDRKRCGTVMNICANMTAKLAIIIEPYLPKTSQRIHTQLLLEGKKWADLNNNELLKEGHSIGEVEVLFRKLEDKEIKAFQDQFCGKQEEKKNEEKNNEKKKTSNTSEASAAEFRVAQVLSVSDHPAADKLYILQISLGEERRQLVAGLRAHLKAEELMGKHVIIVANLKPAQLRGVESKGMLLAAEKNGKVVLLEAKKSEPGKKAYTKITASGSGGTAQTSKEITIQEFSKSTKIEVLGGKIYVNGGLLRTDEEEVIAEIEDGAEVR